MPEAGFIVLHYHLVDSVILLLLALARRDGLVTTDKFCLSRFGRLKLSWWRFPLRLRARPQVNCPSPQEVSAAGGSDAAVAGASGFAAPPGRAAALGQDLSATHGLDPNTTKRRRGPGRPRASSRGGSS